MELKLGRAIRLFQLMLTLALALALVALTALLPLMTAHSDEGSWAHRRPITLTNSLDRELRDYQVKVRLDASNFDFDRAQPNGADLRFSDEDGNKLLNYWIEQYDASTKTATVWVKVPQIPAWGTPGGETVYLYYGNSTAQDLSSGGRTFEMFDDFGKPGLGYYDLSAPATVMTQTEAWETKPPHTLSIVELDRGGYKYWGYYGLADCGGIGVARSNDLVQWQKLPQPLLNKDGERWPSAQKVGDTIYMIYDRDYCGASQLVLRTSKDGIHFDPQYKVIVPQEPGVHNQNPALFRDPKGGKFYLYWYRGGNDVGYWQIKMRSADTVEGLADPSSEKMLIEVPYELAAPNMMAYDGAYFLSTEVNENAWKTKIYSGPSPSGPFTPLPDSPQLSDNQACLFQHVITTTLHGYICKDTGAGWVLNYRSADLSKGRSTQRHLDPGVWTVLQGEWQLKESPGSIASNILLEGMSEHGLLRTALPGADYTISANGRSLSDAWGVVVRLKDSSNYSVAKMMPDSTVAIERIADGRATLLASAPLDNFDMKAWHTLTVKVYGNNIEALVDGALIAKALDPLPALPSGNSALYVEGKGSITQFDNVVWRKFAAKEPAVRVGAREDYNEARANWLGLKQPPALVAAEKGTNIPMSNVNDPLLVAMAAIMTVIALGIVIVGFARSRR